jgi:uncharacterized membrane protein YphA (DoxX/SURF4 family)
MNSIDRTDLVAIFLLGAAIATGNPAVPEIGIAGILLPVVLAVILFAQRTPGRILAMAPWVAAFYISFIFLWYEQYKLTGHPGSVELFTTLTDWAGLHGYEKAMRLFVGISEIIATVILLVPAAQGVGAIGALMLMTGAIFFHLVTPLGVDPYRDGGILFKEACSVLTCSLLVIWWRRDQLMALARQFGVPVFKTTAH